MQTSVFHSWGTLIGLSIPLRDGWTVVGVRNPSCARQQLQSSAMPTPLMRCYVRISARVQDPMDSPRPTPAVMIPSGDGLVTIRPVIMNANSSPDAVHDAEGELNADEWAALEAMSNLHEFACEEWMNEVPQGRVGEWVDGAEQYRVLYARVPDAEACAPIVLPGRIRLRVIRYYDPATWKPGGNWGDGRCIKWTKKTTRPFEMWPELWCGISKKDQQLAMKE
jgi:hypothetical protein